ncbi:glycosyltransferase family 2 protein [Lysinibacillus sp. NPDC056232]|uniref:glycosyltransferase family 2 protein n=1 Tax=Lysinibacillus sp. NPDC056232 TaxID=3345756 RepID=UPI0035D8A75D
MGVKVSVILPVYNAEKYIGKCLESLSQQKLREIEIIAINDGSQDQTLSILNKYRALDERIIIFNTPNRGVSCARNLGIDKATGDYLTFVDADDWIEPTMLEKLYKACLDTGCAISKCDVSFVTQEEISKLNYASQKYQLYDTLAFFEALFTEVYENHFGYACGKLYETSFIQKNGLLFEEDMNFAEDTLFIAKAVVQNGHICYVPQQLYYYNIANEHSLTRGGVQNLQEKYEVLYNRLQEILIKENVFKQVENSFLNYQLEGLMNVTHNKHGLTSNYHHITSVLKMEIQDFLQKYPNVIKVKPLGKSKKKQLLLFLLRVKALHCSTVLIYFNLKRNKVI